MHVFECNVFDHTALIQACLATFTSIATKLETDNADFAVHRCKIEHLVCIQGYDRQHPGTLNFYTTDPPKAKWTHHAFLGDFVYKNDWSACQIPSKYYNHFLTADVCTVRCFVHMHWVKRCDTTIQWEAANNISCQ